MRYREALGDALSSEAKAYGFTLVIWSTGALASFERGLPHPEDVLAFVGGALAGAALAVLVAFGGPLARWREPSRPRYAYGAIHVVSVSLAVLAGWAVAATVPRFLGFLAAGFAATLVYQFLVAFEIKLSLASREEEDVDGA